jgi:hypothetical protein
VDRLTGLHPLDEPPRLVGVLAGVEILLEQREGVGVLFGSSGFSWKSTTWSPSSSTSPYDRARSFDPTS